IPQPSKGKIWGGTCAPFEGGALGRLQGIHHGIGEGRFRCLCRHRNPSAHAEGCALSPAQDEGSTIRWCPEIIKRDSAGEWPLGLFSSRCHCYAASGENVTVELADKSRDLFIWWRKLLFDRVIAAGIDRDYAEKTVKSANLGLDVIKIETLSLLVQCLVCKFDTDAPGVIAKIGRRLRGVELTSFRTPAKAAFAR